MFMHIFTIFCAYLCIFCAYLLIFMYVFISFMHIYAYCCTRHPYLCIFYVYLCIFKHIYECVCIFDAYLYTFVFCMHIYTYLHISIHEKTLICCQWKIMQQGYTPEGVEITASTRNIKVVSEHYRKQSTYIRMLYRSDPMARWRARRCAPIDIWTSIAFNKVNLFI